ncbi:MAG: adenylate kinase [Chloroflexota bacterium]|nr:adenylate kinase [Chloroflexota bacterium]|tara:strand:- start:981 stop:1550 length:570 start_codon:yes stop_codon:yes gene_type:complete
MQNVIIFLGSPGSGKGTQASKLSNSFDYKHISIGDMLRDNVEKQTDLGLKASEFIDSGTLVPDDLIIQVVGKFFEDFASNKDGKVILDGFPRTQPQAIALEKIIKNLDIILTSVVYLNVQDDEVISRLSERGREDDSPELVLNRLNVYRDQTEPLLEYYKNKNILNEIDGNRLPELVFAEISELIGVGA